MSDRSEQSSVKHYHVETLVSDGTHHYFTPQVLDIMLGNNCVLKFRRSSGWVTVGVDPIRAHSRRMDFHDYNGPERRSIH
jgi:hypothetical protein